jgi:hypothetical protein
VINPQDGHILCDRNPMACGFSLRIQVSSRIVKITISRPKERLVAVINATLLGKSCFEPLIDFAYQRGQRREQTLAEKPKDERTSDGLA